MTQYKTQNSWLTANFQSVKSFSRVTSVHIGNISPETRCKVIGFLESMSLSPLLQKDSDGDDTVVSVELPQDSSKEALLEKIVSYVQALGVEGVSVSYSSDSSEKQTDSEECEVYVDSSEYDFVNSEEAERIAKRLEAGDQSEFELILTNPDELGSRGKVRRRQSSKNVISSMRKYRMTSKSRSSICQPRNLVNSNKRFRQTIKRAKDVSVRARFAWWTRFRKAIFPRLSKFRFQQIKRLWTTSYGKFKKTQTPHITGRFVSSKKQKCVNTEACTRDFTCNTLFTTNVKTITENVHESNKNNTTISNIPLPVEAYTQTENSKNYRFRLLQRFSREFKEKKKKCSVSDNTKTSSETHTSNNEETSCKCTQCSCCSQSCSKSAELPAWNQVMQIPKNIFPPFQYVPGQNQPVFYVVPATGMQVVSTNHLAQRKKSSSEDSNGTESKTFSDSSTYCSLSPMKSNVEEKESTKEKVTIYVEKDENGNNRTCKRKVRSVKQIKVINAPINPTIIQRKKSNDFKQIRDMNLAITQQRYLNENKRLLKNQLVALNQINEEKLKFMKQLEDLNNKLAVLTSLENKHVDKSAKNTTNETNTKNEVELKPSEDSKKVDAKVMTAEVGTLCTQQVDTAVECVMMVDAFSECNEQKCPETENKPKKEELRDDMKNLPDDDDYEDDVESFESNSYRYTQKSCPAKNNSKTSYFWDLPFHQQIFYCSDNKSRKNAPKYPQDSLAPTDPPLLRSYSPPPIEESKKPKNTCSFLTTIFGGRTSRHENKLKKQAIEITEIKKLISQLNNDLRQELDHEEQLDEDSDEGETVQFCISRPKHVKKCVTFSTPLVQ